MVASGGGLPGVSEVVYDLDGNGLGEIADHWKKAPYLKELGIDACSGPFYPSELAADMTSRTIVMSHRRLGTLADFDEMTAALHEAGIRVVVDIVPNHTSDQHVRFKEAVNRPKGSPARNRYIFRENRIDEDGNEQIPSSTGSLNVRGTAVGSVCGRPSGTCTPSLLQQPDLNWDNPEARESLRTSWRFGRTGVSTGSRIDVAHSLVKDQAVIFGPDPVPTWAEMEKLPGMAHIRCGMGPGA